MRALKIILVATACMAGEIAACGAMPIWETVQAYQEADQPDNEKVEVSVRDGYIYVSTSHPVEVKVLSIVGQLISSKNLPAGVSRLRVSTRGVYILKAGSTTMRVNI